MTTPIAVTGATGQLGGRIARRLADAGVTQRLVVRDTTRAPDLAGAELAQASFRDSPAVRSALEGVATVLMVSAAEAPDRVDQHRSFIDSAVAAGVEHLVYISFYGAAKDARFTLARDHWATEEHLKASGLQWTFLRDNLYLDVLPMFAGTDGVIRGPAADGLIAAIAQDDIADVAVAVLQAPADHVGRTYQLTGPEALSLDEVATALTTVAGHPIRYERETVDQAYASRAHYGAPTFQLDAWVSTYTAIAAGELAGVTEDVPRLAGHPATSFTDLLLSNPGLYQQLVGR
jgi:uncharacterized protein YbjT (DUF2867 family)